MRLNIHLWYDIYSLGKYLDFAKVNDGIPHSIIITEEGYFSNINHKTTSNLSDNYHQMNFPFCTITQPRKHP